MTRIAVDIYATLHPYWGQLEAVALRRYGIALSYEEQETWHIDRLAPEQLAVCVAETHGEELVLAAEPYPGAVETIDLRTSGESDVADQVLVLRPRDVIKHFPGKKVSLEEGGLVGIEGYTRGVWFRPLALVVGGIDRSRMRPRGAHVRNSTIFGTL